MTEVVQKLFQLRSSITQVIHHSHVWSAKFASYAAEVEDGISQRIKNVKGAKHRHESKAKPRGRFVLFMDAYIQLAVHMLHGREDETANYAKDFLSFLSEEVAVQAAMLADASDEGLLFTRILDNEATDAAQMQVLAEDFLGKLQSLFCDRQCLYLEGTYTHFMLESLRRPRVFAPTRSAPLRQLGGRPVPECIIDRCLARMQRYVKLVVAVTAAEFPSFSLFCAFRIFHLETRATLLAGDARGGARDALRASAEHARRASTSPEPESDQDEHLRKLAKFFKVDATALRLQYHELKVCAQRHKSATGSDNATAWREAVRCFSVRHRALDGHPYWEIIQVLMRYVAFSISTAAVEQNFAVFKRTFGEQSAGGNSFENRMVKMILVRHCTPESDHAVCHKAQHIYITYGGVARGAYRKRRDAGGVSKRPHGLGGGEKQWLRRRREAVRTAAAKRARISLKDVGEQALDEDDDVDTAKGAELLEKQRKIFDRAKVDAYLDGVLLEEEEEGGLQELVQEELQARDKRARTRAAHKKRLAARTGKWSGATEVCRGARCFIDASVASVDLQGAVHRRGCHCVPREDATIFIVQDVTSPPLRVHWNVVLHGGYLVTPRAFSEEVKGPMICHTPAKKVKRNIFMTDAFRETHPEVTRLIMGIRTWKFHHSVEDREGKNVDKGRRDHCGGGGGEGG